MYSHVYIDIGVINKMNKEDRTCMNKKRKDTQLKLCKLCNGGLWFWTVVWFRMLGTRNRDFTQNESSKMTFFLAVKSMLCFILG